MSEEKKTEDKEYIIGKNPVIAALEAGTGIERIYVAGGGQMAAVRRLASERGVRVDVTDKSKLDKMVPGLKHQGIVAEISAYKYAEMDDVFRKAASSGEDPFVILLDEIGDPHNLGAIIRSAECAGAHGVIIPKRRAAGLTEVVAKTSAGAIATMPVVRVTNMARTIDELKARGLWIAACDMDGETYYKADLSGPVGLVIGNEGSGVGRLVKEHCDFVISMPIRGKTDSLNASNAAAIAMYEVRRQRDTK